MSSTAGAGSAVHSCGRSAASPVLLTVPLRSPGRGIKRDALLQVAGAPQASRRSMFAMTSRGVVLRGPRGFSSAGARGEGQQARAVPSVLPQPPQLVAMPEGSELSSGSARVMAKWRCLCQPAWPAPCPCCQRPRRAGGRPADRSGAQCQTGLEAGSATRGLSWKEETRKLQIYYSKVQGCGLTG